MRYFGGKDKKYPYNPFNDVWLHKEQDRAWKLAHASVTQDVKASALPKNLQGLHFVHEDDEDSLAAAPNANSAAVQAQIKKADRVYSLKHTPVN